MQNNFKCNILDCTEKIECIFIFKNNYFEGELIGIEYLLNQTGVGSLSDITAELEKRLTHLDAPEPPTGHDVDVAAMVLPDLTVPDISDVNPLTVNVIDYILIHILFEQNYV